MVVFDSKLPNIDCMTISVSFRLDCASPLTCLLVPTDTTVWDWLFESSSSPLNHVLPQELAGYVDAETKERLNWAQFKEATTLISTALVKIYNFRAHDTITLFSGNTVWYSVAMFSAVRIGGVVSGASPAYTVDTS